MYIFVFAAALSSAAALYSSQDDVVDLTPTNFHTKVMNSDELWLIEFYAPWCGHCQSLVPEYKKAAKALKGVVRFGAVDANEHQGLGSQYGVQGFPTLKFFGQNKYKPEDYSGARTAQGMVDAAMSKLKSLVNERMGGKSGGGSRSGGNSGGSGNANDVVELTDSNFEELVMKGEDIWMVEFFAPWCGHCKNLAPHWALAATQMKGKVKFGALDATVHQNTASRYGVRGYPTIKAFENGKDQEYDGGRTSSDIVEWVKSHFDVEKIPPPEVIQVVSQESFGENCEGHPICVISILPNILDCQSECRNNYIKLLTKMGDTFKKMKWGWIWAEAMAQPELENALGIGGFGYPAMAAVNSKKLKFSLLTRAFSETGIREFLRDLSYGKGSTAPLSKLPEIAKSDPWDGKDGELPVEEDIDLSDVDLDDLGKDEL